jgi:hypothetical protein
VTVKNVKIILHLQDGYEKDYTSLEKVVGDMGPGRSVTWDDFNYYNYNNFYPILFKVEIKHDKIKK